MNDRGTLSDEHDKESVSESHDSMPRKRRWIVKLLIWCFAFLFLFLLFSLLSSHVSINQLHEFNQVLKKVDQSFFQWIRLAFITILIGYWKPIITWIARRHDWSEARLLYTLKQRWVMLGALAFVELVIVRQVHLLILH